MRGFSPVWFGRRGVLGLPYSAKMCWVEAYPMTLGNVVPGGVATLSLAPPATAASICWHSERLT